MQTPSTRSAQYTGYLQLFLELSQHCAELRAHYERIARNPRTKPATIHAVWEGWYALKCATEKKARELTKSGQLLFAHQGTTYFQHRPKMTAMEAYGLPMQPPVEVPA